MTDADLYARQRKDDELEQDMIADAKAEAAFRKSPEWQAVLAERKKQRMQIN
jgi:hypothetical protein